MPLGYNNHSDWKGTLVPGETKIQSLVNTTEEENELVDHQLDQYFLNCQTTGTLGAPKQENHTQLYIITTEFVSTRMSNISTCM